MFIGLFSFFVPTCKKTNMLSSSLFNVVLLILLVKCGGKKKKKKSQFRKKILKTIRFDPMVYKSFIHPCLLSIESIRFFYFINFILFYLHVFVNTSYLTRVLLRVGFFFLQKQLYIQAFLTCFFT
jgi:hypothetical protein